MKYYRLSEEELRKYEEHIITKEREGGYDCPDVWDKRNPCPLPSPITDIEQEFEKRIKDILYKWRINCPKTDCMGVVDLNPSIKELTELMAGALLRMDKKEENQEKKELLESIREEIEKISSKAPDNSFGAGIEDACSEILDLLSTRIKELEK